jgi:rod shape determining protein RodA
MIPVKGGGLMRQLWEDIKYTPYVSEVLNFFRKGDLVLLFLCLLTSGFGCLVVASATNHNGTLRYLVIQAVAVVLGAVAYILVSAVSADFLAEHRMALVAFNTFMLLLLLTPFGEDYNSGNRSWLVLPLMPMAIQPAEFCKITYVIIMASVLNARQNSISSHQAVFHMAWHLAMVAGLNIVISGDVGVSLIFIFMFAMMAMTAGVHWGWFALAGGFVAVAAPIAWFADLVPNYMKERIISLFDHSIDPEGLDPRYQIVRSLLSLNGGGLTGQGLFNGNRTQVGALPAQHTDFVFSAIGEELGFLGCMLTVVLLALIIVRCIWVGMKSKDFLRRMICFGVAATLIFQCLMNIGMNVELLPIIGLTLPFISYGGSSIVSLFAMMGLVSGVHARPEPKPHERYIQQPPELTRWY